MSLRRDADGLVTLVDLVSNKQLRVNAPTARENLKYNPGRYVTKAKYDEDVNQRRIDEAVAKKIAEEQSKAVVKSSNDEVDDAIIEAHNKVLEEVGDEEDDRLTATRLLKTKVLAELVGREVDRAEYMKYSNFVQTARAAQSSE